MKRLTSIFAFFVLSISAFAQNTDIEQSFRTGEDLFNKQKYLEALPYLENAANSGSAEAQFLIGKMFHQALGVSPDYTKAFHWYKKSAEQGNAKAQNNIGSMYAKGTGVSKDDSEALKWYRKAADQGLAIAQVNVGNLYRLSESIPKNLGEAFKWYMKAAEQGNVGGQMNIAFMYQKGEGVTKNLAEAEKWFLKSANQGNQYAQDALGSMYEYENGIINYIEAAKWYSKAADQGNLHSLFNLGVMYERGKGVKQDYKQAMNLYLKAAEKNYVLAQDNIGYMYENGLGVMKSSSTAVKWYRKAADQGHPNALNNLGRMYFSGKGVKKDYAEAAWLIQQAAEKGDVRAMSNMGVLYENGYGVQKDFAIAVQWYHKALVGNPNDAEARNGYMRLRQYMPIQNEEVVSNSRPKAEEKKEEDSPIDASGTGFLIDKRGYLATNNHVTKGAKGIYVCLQVDGVWKSYNAVLVKNDPTNDLSIIRIDDTEFKPFVSLPYNFTTEVEDVASDIYTLGYPQVHIMGTEVKYTTGAINSKSGVQGDPTHYQISAHIDHGNSGGPMFNSKGTIIGITDSGLNKAEYGDVNYAIKSSYLKSLVDALPVKLDLPHDTSIEKLSRVEQIKVLSKYTALILIDLP